MRVLHIETGRHLYGGAKQVVYLLNGLNGLGVENLLLAPRDSSIAAAVGTSARVMEFQSFGDFDLGLAPRVASLMSRERVDLLHVHSRRGADLYGGIGARLSSKPCVLSRRVDNPGTPIWSGLKYRLYDRIIAISEGIRSVLVGEGVDPNRVVTVRSALDPAPYIDASRRVDRRLFRVRLGLPENSFLIGMVAQFIERKGHRYLIEAFRSIVHRHDACHLLLYGKGPLQPEISAQVQRSGLVGRVHLFGFVEDLEQQLPALDLVVHPAEMEGLGVSLLQAAASEIAVVASKVGGIPEAVLDGYTGVLVDPGSVDQLVDAISNLVHSDSKRLAMGRAGRERVLSDFSTSAMVEGNLKVYRSILC